MHSERLCDIILRSIRTDIDFARGAGQKNRSALAENDLPGGKQNQKYGGKKHERNFNETAFGSRCPFRTSDKKIEPQNGGIHLHGKKRDLYY